MTSKVSFPVLCNTLARTFPPRNPCISGIPGACPRGLPSPALSPMKLLHAQHPRENAQGQGTRRVPRCLVLESPPHPQPLVLALRPCSSACHTCGDCTVPRPLPEGICCPRSLWSGLLLSPNLSPVPRGGSLDQETSLWPTSHLGPRGSHKGLSWTRSPKWGQCEVGKPAEAVARKRTVVSCMRAPTESLSVWGSPSSLHPAQSWSEGQVAPSIPSHQAAPPKPLLGKCGCG